MNKFIGIAAAAMLVASSGGAVAGQKYLSFDGYCDFLSGVKNDATTSVAVHNGTTNCGFTDNGVAVGTEATIPGMGKYLVFGDNEIDAEAGTYTGYALYVAIQLPLKTGNGWFLYETVDGATIAGGNSGTYTLSNKVPAASRTRLPASFKVHAKLQPPG